MILLWISIPDLHFIQRRHPLNFFWIRYSFESYFVHMKSPRTYVDPDIKTDRQTDRQTDGDFFLLVLSSKTYKS